MSLKNKYDYVVVRNEQSLGLSRNAFDYLLNLEKNIERLKASEYCPYDKKCGQLYECTKEEYQNMCNANTKLSLENDNLRYRLENAIADCQLRLKEVRKQQEVIDKSIDFIKNGDLLYLANKNSVVYRNNIEIRAVADRLNDLLQILEDKEV